MGNCKSKDHIKIYSTGDFYTAYVNTGLDFRILCQSSDILHIKKVIKKYKNDPGAFTFRYKI